MRTWSVQGLTSRVGRRTPRVRSKVQRVLAERKSVSRRPHDVTSVVHGVGRRMHRVGGEARGVGHRRTGVAQRVRQRARESTAACARERSGVRGDCRAVCRRALDVPTVPRSRVGPNDLGGSSPDVQCLTGREAWTGERVAWRLARSRWCRERRTWLGESGAVVLACRCVATIETRRGAPLASRVASSSAAWLASGQWVGGATRAVRRHVRKKQLTLARSNYELPAPISSIRSTFSANKVAMSRPDAENNVSSGAKYRTTAQKCNCRTGKSASGVKSGRYGRLTLGGSARCREPIARSPLRLVRSQR